MDKIAIIGLGLIGGSLGLALRQQKNPNWQVLGFDTDLNVGAKAARRGAVEKVHFNLADVLDGANLVFIATPVLSIREVLQNIAGLVSPGCIVTDTGGTKEAVMEWAATYLPQGVHFIGGNPLARRDQSGIDNARPDLFKGTRYVLIPSKSASEEAIRAMVGFVEVLQAKPYFIDPYEHDSYAAAVNHAPMLLSTALVTAASKSPAWREMARQAGSDFESFSAPAAGDPLTNLDQCLTNREGIVHWTNETIRELVRLRDLVTNATDEAGAEALGQTLARAWEAREAWHARYLTGDTSDDDDRARRDLPSMGDQMTDFFIGPKLRERYQQVFSFHARKEQERQQRRFRRS